MQRNPLRVIQASPADPTRAIEMAWILGCQAIAWDLREDCASAVRAARSARLRSEGWYSVARDPEAATQHPEWMHAPESDAWLGAGPQGGLQLVAPYIALNNAHAFDHAHREIVKSLVRNDWCSKLWLADIQGPPMGCGCGNPCCRSWDNSPGAKIVAENPYDLPDRFFSELLFEAVMQSIWNMERPMQVSPILCPDCEHGISLCGVEDPDGPCGTNRCHGICHGNPSATDYWPELLARFRYWGGSLFVPQVALLLMCDALEKNHPVYGGPRNWPMLAHEHYGRGLFPCVEPADARLFEACMIMLDAPQNCWPVSAPAGYERALATVNR